MINTSASLGTSFKFLMMNTMKQHNFYGIADLISGRRTFEDIGKELEKIIDDIGKGIIDIVCGIFGC